MTFTISGHSVSSGIAIGRAVVATSPQLHIQQYFIDEEQLPNEIEHLKKARELAQKEFQTLYQQLAQDTPAEVISILDAHIAILLDDIFFEEILHWIQEKNYNAGWALETQRQLLVEQFEEIKDPYLKERYADVNHVFGRLQRALGLLSEDAEPLQCELPDYADNSALILIERDIAPADILQLKQSVFSGFVTDVGGKTSHSAIVARSLGIPAIVGSHLSSRLIRHNDWVIVDCNSNTVIVDPPQSILSKYQELQQKEQTEKERLKSLRHTQAITQDQETIELFANIELPEDAHKAHEAGAMGIGLFRTEFLFMNRKDSSDKPNLPDEEEQFQAYKTVLEAMQGKPVTIRTIDIGADKPINPSQTYPNQTSGSNPALGLRAVRWSLAEPDIFLTQLRALLRAACYGKLLVLVPMLTHVWQIQQVFALLEKAKKQLQQKGVEFGEVQMGAMIEVPASVLILDSFIRYFDFLSVGSNDLIQYTLAIDRVDDSVAHLFDPMHPAVLKLLDITISKCNLANKKISVCGEMAGDTTMTRLLLGMGLRNFSMNQVQISEVKQEIMRCDTTKLRPLAQLVIASEDPFEQQSALENLQSA